MGIDIAIPLARDRYHSYYELKMTLRSIETNLTGYRNIYIIGEKPNWITNVTHIPLKDLTGRKAYSIYRKMLTAANNESVSTKFISWSDDTYLLEPLNVEGIKDWYDETLKDWTFKNINNLYRNIIKNTWKVFPDGLFYNVHTPCVYEKERFIGLNKYNWTTTEYLIKSMYFNDGESNPVPMKDPKRHKGLFYSTQKMTGEDDKMLRGMFSKKSKFEL
jgi:hypothetical protein